MAWIYAIKIDQKDGYFVVSAEDLPEICTIGENLDEALSLAQDAVEAVVVHRIEKGIELPNTRPPIEGEYAVSLSAAIAAKASVYSLWRTSGISKSELARRMAIADNEAHRILNPRHNTKIDVLDKAARALGARLVVGFAA